MNKKKVASGLTGAVVVFFSLLYTSDKGKAYDRIEPYIKHTEECKMVKAGSLFLPHAEDKLIRSIVDQVVRSESFNKATAWQKLVGEAALIDVVKDNCTFKG